MEKQAQTEEEHQPRAHAAQLAGTQASEAWAVPVFKPAQQPHGPAAAPRQLIAVPVLQQQPIVQRKEIPEIDADLDREILALAAIAPIAATADVGTITTRQGVLAALPARIDPIAAEVATKGGGAAPTLAALDARVAAIDAEIPRLTADIAEGEGPQPAGGGWGAVGARLAWSDKNKKLGENRAKRTSITNERGELVAARPLSVIKDKLAGLQASYGRLKDNLKTAEENRYFQLLMTTTAPAMTTHKYEGKWESGESDLGIFIFSAGDLQGIPSHGIRVEVHIHFTHGTKTVNRAHIKSGWTYTILYPAGPAYAAAAIAACRAAMP